MSTRNSPGSYGNGRLIPVLGTLIAILLTAIIGIIGYLNARLVATDQAISALQAQQAATVAMANARLDALALTAERIERQIEKIESPVSKGRDQ